MKATTHTSRSSREANGDDAYQCPAQLLTEEEVCRILRIDTERTRAAQRKALDRAWRQAQDIRSDRKLSPLTRIRIGARRFYEASAVSALLEALSFEF